MLDRMKHYFSEDLWNFHLDKKNGLRSFFIKCLRVIYLSVRGFLEDKCSLSASSLTYYTLMSIIPVLAMAFAVTRSFGYHEVFRKELLQRFQDQNVAFTEMFKYADAFLEQAKSGVIAGFGVVILFVTVALLLSNLEGILNQIWGVKRLRSWRRLFSDYFALMLIGPLFFVVASSTSVYVVGQLEIGIRAIPLGGWATSWLLFLVNLIPYGLFWILFTFIYLFMPNTKVNLSSACVGGVVASCLYIAVQWGYIYFQVGVSRYGAIYGSMAALPLLLVWVQLSWFIFLFGAEISCAHQTMEEHEFARHAERMSPYFRRLLSLWMVHLGLKEGFLSRTILKERYQIPFALARPILEALVQSRLFYETKEGYLAAHGTFEMRISDVIQALESRGENAFPYFPSKALVPFEKALDYFRKQLESSPENIRLSHVPDSF